MAYSAKRYEGNGLLAIDPSALFEVFVVGDGTARDNVEADGCTLVSVHGPLDQHASRWCDSYEAITARIADACKQSQPAIVMLLDSPGGEAAGCIEAAREIRAMCDAAGKSLFAFVEDKAASAAYALASAAREIILAETAVVGSIGILQTRTDYSAMNAARGVNVQFIASGSRKAFGNPDAPLTEAEVKDTQQLVNSVADVFFKLVADMRGASPEAIAQLQAGVFHGQTAIGAGLADAVMPLKTALASIARTQGKTAMAADGDKKKDDGGSDFDSARAALEKMAKGDDANAKRAKIALAALEAEGDDADGGKKAEGGGDADGDKKAEGDGDEKKAESGGDDDGDGDTDKKEDKTEAAYRMALRAERRAQKLEAQLQAKDDAAERDKLLAAHPDLTASMVALLRKSPLPLVRETLAEIDAEAAGDDTPPPSKGVSARTALAASQPGTKPTQPARSTADGMTVSHLPADQKAKLDARCGLMAETTLGIRESEHRLELGVIVPKQSQPAGGAGDRQPADPADIKRKHTAA